MCVRVVSRIGLSLDPYTDRFMTLVSDYITCITGMPSPRRSGLGTLFSFVTFSQLFGFIFLSNFLTRV